MEECSKGALRHERLRHDLNKVTTIVTSTDSNISPLSIQLNEHSKQPHPY